MEGIVIGITNSAERTNTEKKKKGSHEMCARKFQDFVVDWETGGRTDDRRYNRYLVYEGTVKLLSTQHNQWCQ